MKFFKLFGFALVTLSLAYIPNGSGSAANTPVIVIMKNHRLQGFDMMKDQASVMAEIQSANATHVKKFKLVNSFAATVPQDEVDRLKTNPNVELVVPDVVIHRSRRPQDGGAVQPGAGGSLAAQVVPGACDANGHPQLNPEALQTTHTDSDDPKASTARSLGFTGAGVKVAYIADGIDPKNVNFIRADGTSAFIDYQDFSGDGPGATTAGGEAFLDANAIAGQGLHVYNVNGLSAQSYSTPCNIRIEGMAPGAQIVGLKIFSQYDVTTESAILQAIDYAVFTDHVDVLNESFGSNDFPDVTAQDATKLFNDAAVKAGVTVTVSSGDAGPSNTFGSPATDPLVISTGASTTFRFYAQTNFGGARYFAPAGWLSDNISALSSSGYSEDGATVDLVAPGDMGFASCDANSTFLECTNFMNKPSEIEASGGTSMSAPLTAGAAALVIEAYRKAHQGASPSPALVKQILASSAMDLGLPSIEQGAGLLNSYKAVLLAETINGGKAPSPIAARQQPLLISAQQLNAAGAAGASFSWPVTIMNPGSAVQHVRVSGRTLAPEENVQTGQVTLSDASSQKFTSVGGTQVNYAEFKFRVPHSGVKRLNASIAYPGNPQSGASAVRLVLVDPNGKLAAYTLPQGIGNFGAVDVREPAPGTWTGVVFGSLSATGGTNGTIPWRVSTQKFTSFGSVSPERFNLEPGQSRVVTVSARSPADPGDVAGAIVVKSVSENAQSRADVSTASIPVTLRSVIGSGGGGSFAGVLTGGNGRDPGEGQIDYFQIHVDPGHSSLTADVSLSNDPQNAVGLYLVNPFGVAVAFGQNNLDGHSGLSASVTALNPDAGDWTLVVDFAGAVAGNEISEAFSGKVSFDGVSAEAPSLPHDKNVSLAAGTPLSIPLTIVNTGAASEAFFVDARLASTANVTLAALNLPAGFKGYPVPHPAQNPVLPLWLVPTETSGLQVFATATIPIEFDFSPTPGDPDLFGAPDKNSGGNVFGARASYAPEGGLVTQGLWGANPAGIGPFPQSGEPAGLATMTMVATVKPFDPAVSSSTGDLWLTSVDAAYKGFRPMIVAPGQSALITVTITPKGAPGSVVSGTLYVDDVMPGIPPAGQVSGNEVYALPYTYTVK